MPKRPIGGKNAKGAGWSASDTPMGTGALHIPHFLSIPAILSRSDLMATVPHALALYFARLAPQQFAVAAPPFEIAGFDVKQHWHRKFHNDARSRWLRRQVVELFNDATDEWR